MTDLPRPHRLLGKGRAEWDLKGQIHSVNRLGPRGPIELGGRTRRGDPLRVILPLYEAARLGDAITAATEAARLKENNHVCQHHH